MSKPYTLRSPCGNCPFRTDVDLYLREERVREIAAQLHSNAGDFYCHKTTGGSEAGEFDPSGDGRARVCAGALITLENENRPTQMMRIAERLGMYDRTELDMDAPVSTSMNEWVRAKTGKPLYPDA